MPDLEAEVEDGQGDGRQEDGGASFVEVQRDGAVQLPASAASGLRHVQELRGLVPRGLHGWQRRGDVGQGRLLRAEGGGCGWRQEEVSMAMPGAATCTALDALERVVGAARAACDALTVYSF